LQWNRNCSVFSIIFSTIFRNYLSRSPSNVLYIQIFSRISSFFRMSIVFRVSKSTVIGPCKWPTFIAVALFWVGEASAQTNEKITVIWPEYYCSLQNTCLSLVKYRPRNKSLKTVRKRQKWRKSQQHAFLLRIGLFQAQISRSKHDQSWTYCSVLESAECEQQNSDQITVSFSLVWADSSPTQNEATAIKVGLFQGPITADWPCLLKNLLAYKKSCYCWTFWHVTQYYYNITILHTLRCNTIATIVFFQTFFRRFLYQNVQQDL
jgi:hypothetical protein